MIAGYSMLLYAGPFLTTLFLVARLIIKHEMKHIEDSLRDSRSATDEKVGDRVELMIKIFFNFGKGIFFVIFRKYYIF